MNTRLTIVPNKRATAFDVHHREPCAKRQLEVNVVFTTRLATMLALRTAAAFVANLDACIRLRAVIAVPLGLPLENPQISIPFMQRTLTQLVTQLDDRLNITIHLYISRDRVTTLSRVLHPSSLIMLAGRRRPWPTEDSRTAHRLQSEGHPVVFLPFRRRD